MPVAELPGAERLLVEAAALAGRPLPLAVVAGLLELGPEEALSIGERLTEEGYLQDTPAGFSPVPGTVEEVLASIGSARRSTDFGRLADAFLAEPGTAGDPEVGVYLLRAGRAGEALPRLAESGVALVRAGAAAEALPFLDGAIEAFGTAGDDPSVEGRLHLARAEAYRTLGRSEEASGDADVATRRLSGPELVDAYGWAASLADDRQCAQEAERLLAMGEYAAVSGGELGKLGSLLTLRARVLGRLGFGDEADAAVERGLAVLEEHGTRDQRTRALYNRAWIAFDKGRMSLAEARFAELTARFEDAGVASAAADARAWRARALMYAGRPDEGLAEAEAAAAGGEIGPRFLAAMARASGAALYGAGDAALEAADELLGIVLEHLPQWENGARYLRAQALQSAGRLEDAAEEADRAILACPDGIDGESWRLRCRSLALRIAAAQGRSWPAAVADEVTEAALTSRWHLPAALLLAARARREKDPELARRGAALALQLGIPMVAARNAEAGGLWEEDTGKAVSVEIRRLVRRVPGEWRKAWEALPEVASALAVPEPSDREVEEAAAAIREDLEATFEEIGLSGADRVLSPAQRRAAGMRLGRRRLRRPLWQTLVGVGGVLLVAAVAVTALLLAMREPEPDVIVEAGPTVTVTVTTEPAPTTLPPVWDRILPGPSQELTSQWAHRGERPAFDDDRGLTGSAPVTGVREAGGYYWRQDTNASITAGAVVRGRNLFVGNAGGSFFVYETDGDLLRTLSPETNRRINTSAAVELVGATPSSEASRRDVVLFGDTEGRLHASDAGDGSSLPDWDAAAGDAVSTAPMVIGDLVLIGSRDGYVHAFSLAANGELAWRFPADGSGIEPSKPVDGIAYHDGVAYVAREDGSLYGIDPSTGELAMDGDRPLCAVAEGGLQGTPAGNPIAHDGYLYVGAGSFVWRFDAGDCRVPDTVTFIEGGEASAAPALDTRDMILYQPIGFFVLAFDVSTGVFPAPDHVCQYPIEGGRVRIRSAPSVALPEGEPSIVYFGGDDGVVHAIDGESCDQLWEWPTGGAVISSPALGDGVVFVTSEDGVITAIGPAPVDG